jgi:hypothetical protein
VVCEPALEKSTRQPQSRWPTSININLAIKYQDFHFSMTSAHSPTLSKDFFVVFTIIRLIEKSVFLKVLKSIDGFQFQY